MRMDRSNTCKLVMFMEGSWHHGRMDKVTASYDWNTVEKVITKHLTDQLNRKRHSEAQPGLTYSYKYIHVTSSQREFFTGANFHSEFSQTSILPCLLQHLHLFHMCKC